MIPDNKIDISLFNFKFDIKPIFTTTRTDSSEAADMIMGEDSSTEDEFRAPNFAKLTQVIVMGPSDTAEKSPVNIPLIVGIIAGVLIFTGIAGFIIWKKCSVKQSQAPK